MKILCNVLMKILGKNTCQNHFYRENQQKKVRLFNSASESGLVCSVPSIFVEPISFLINCDLICSYSYAHHIYFMLLYGGHLVTVHMKLLALFRSRLHSLLVGYIQPTLKFRDWIVHESTIESYSISMKKVLTLLLHFYGDFRLFLCYWTLHLLVEAWN